MNHQRPFCSVLDTLYGDLSFEAPIVELLRTPAVQRLRHVRLSNIDSLSMPGLAGLTRYEHALGTAHLVTRLGMFRNLNTDDALILQAAALLHDSALPPFGHLVEEAFHYVGATFAHENKWLAAHMGEALPNEVGGTEIQLMFGRPAGLKTWAAKHLRSRPSDHLKTILETILGHGPFGPLIASDLDLDNLDNLARVAYHIGLRNDPTLGPRLAACIVDCNARDGVIIADDGLVLAEQWLKLRSDVYERLMLAREDFCGKLMLIYATVTAYERGAFSDHDWHLTDEDFLGKLLKSPVSETADAAQRWLLGDLWDLADLVWMYGEAPPYPQILEYSVEASKLLDRQCFAYRIKDKRTRAVSFTLQGGKRHSFGRKPNTWLLGVGSAVRKEFTLAAVRKLRGLAIELFGTSVAQTATSSAHAPTLSLF